MVEIRECTPDDALLASIRLHAIAPRHIRVSPYPDDDRCKASLVVSTKRNLKRTTLSASRFRFFICCYSTRKIYTVWVNEESLLFCYKTVTVGILSRMWKSTNRRYVKMQTARKNVNTQIPPHEEIRADRQAVQRRTSVPVRFEFRFVPSSHMAGAWTARRSRAARLFKRPP